MSDKPCPKQADKHHLHTGAQPPHPCPYAQDVGNDDKTLCECCAACTYECAQDV